MNPPDVVSSGQAGIDINVRMATDFLGQDSAEWGVKIDLPLARGAERRQLGYHLGPYPTRVESVAFEKAQYPADSDNVYPMYKEYTLL